MKTINSLITVLDFPLELPILQAVQVTGEDYLSSPFSFLMTLHTETENVKIDKLIKQPISFQLGNSDTSKAKCYHGLIYSAELLTNDVDAGATLQLLIRPRLQWLHDVVDSRVYAVDTPLTLIQIVERVFKRHGLTNYQLSLSKNYETVDCCVQYQESDLNFVSRLLEQAGIYYYFLHTQNDHQLILEDAPTPSLGTTQTLHHSEDTHSKPHIHQWKATAKPSINSISAMRYDFTQAKQPISATSHNPTEQTGLPEGFVASRMMYDRVPHSANQHRLAELTKQQLKTTLATRFQIEAKSNTVNIQAGTEFKLASPLREDQNGNFYIVGIRYHVIDKHSLSQESPECHNQHYENHFMAYQITQAFTPSARIEVPLTDEHSLATKSSLLQLDYPKISGLLTATVTGPKDTPIYSDKYGRVKVQFDWDQYSQNNENSFSWVRLKQQWSSDQFGMQFIPRVGDKVIVSFQFGDPNQPIVIGSMANDSHPLPFPLEQNGFRSHSLNNKPHNNGCTGNELRFNDSVKHPKVHLEAYRDMKFMTAKDKQFTVNGTSQTTVTHGNYDQTVAGNIMIEASKSISLTNGNSQIKITGSEITLQSKQLRFGK